jgi:hypothetical protein
LYPGGTKSPKPLDGTWVGIAMEVFRSLYLGVSDGFGLGGSGFGLGGSGFPIGAWVTTTFSVEIVVAHETIVEWAIWRGRIK